MMINPARTTRHHLANQAAPAYFLIRKTQHLRQAQQVAARQQKCIDGSKGES